MLRIELLAALVTVGIALPHALPMRRADAVGAIAVWCAALALRALVGVFFVIWAVFFLPATELFGAMTHWCWHSVVPLLTTHLGLNGHSVGSAAVVIPGLLLAASVLSVGFGVWRVARAVQRLLRTSAVGDGPDGAVIVGGPDVLVAAAGIGCPKVVISTGALTSFDDEELAAALAHERGHIEHRHRFILLFAEVCRALARYVPGTKRAVRELAFHLERDADGWALRTHDRFVLASAILKAASWDAAPHGAAVTQLAGPGQLEERLGALVDGDGHRGARRRVLRGFAVFFTALSLALTVSVPAAVATGINQQPLPVAHDCPD